MILHWVKVPKAMPVEEWMKISADSAPPGVYTPNMSEKDSLKWKAKIINGADPRVEIRKSFHWYNNKKHPNCVNYGSQTLIVVRLKANDEPEVLLSTNGKIAMSYKETTQLQQAIEEAREVLKNILK